VFAAKMPDQEVYISPTLGIEMKVETDSVLVVSATSSILWELFMLKMDSFYMQQYNRSFQSKHLALTVSTATILTGVVQLREAEVQTTRTLVAVISWVEISE
jgi:hypothetical protein